jgi:hypothetical protein
MCRTSDHLCSGMGMKIDPKILVKIYRTVPYGIAQKPEWGPKLYERLQPETEYSK